MEKLVVKRNLMIVCCGIFVFMVAGCGIAASQIPIIVSRDASETERLAAEELQRYLSKIYPSEKFVISNDSANTASCAIRIGTVKSQPELKKYLTNKSLSDPESYVVTKNVIDGKPTGIVFGADDAGVMYGVYGLLEKLGCGFYLTKDILPTVALDISPMVDLYKKLASGKYKLTIYASAAPGTEQCKVRFQTEQNSTVDNIQGISYTLKNSNQSDVTVYVIEKEIHLEKSAMPKLQIVPQEGALVLHGLKLEA